MRMTRTAIGLAAVGAGWLVTRMLGGRKGEEVPGETQPLGEPGPQRPLGAEAEGASLPPDQLTGYPLSNKSARQSAEVLARSGRRPS